jgi:putative radical SAM enzyme (TIGR03279 family)
MGGVIASVEPGSIAEEVGLRAGDEVMAINGHPLRDVIDYRFYGAEESLEILVRQDGAEAIYEIERDYDDDLGIEFTAPTFDGLRTCDNHCPFCYLKGMPPGLRPSLYVPDDDYRLSFLFGNFVTLTNLDESDWDRLAEQRLGPLYVSVHSTDLSLRRRLLGNSSAPDVLAQLQRLAELGIQVHAQIVLVPGWNDGEHLSRSVADLAALHPAVQSIAVVPVGLTRYQRGRLRLYIPNEAREVLAQIAPWQADFRRRYGITLVYPADEWYLLAGRPVPAAGDYDGFPQIENGVGLVRHFLDEWRDAMRTDLRGFVVSAARLSSPKSQPNGLRDLGGPTVVCGTLIAPLMRQVMGKLAALTGATVEVQPVVNEFFGETVTVSGLLTGQDVIGALRGRSLGDLVLLPRVMFDAAGERTLDGLRLSDIQAALGMPVAMAGTAAELLDTAAHLMQVNAAF